jgi:Glycosyl transferases group 1
MNDWGEYGRAYEMIARSLARIPDVNRVIVVFPPKIVNNRFGTNNYLFPFFHRKVSDKLGILTPNLKIFPKSIVPLRIGEWLNKDFRDLSMRSFLRASGFSRNNTILWIYPPHGYIDHLIRIIPHRFLITQIVDNNIHIENQSAERRDLVTRQYHDLSRMSDLVFTSSRQNQDYFSSINPECCFFENALDEIFIGNAEDLPHRINNKRPRLGYVGWITDRTDLELLTFIANSRPGYDLVIAGPKHANLSLEALKSLPNVIIKGAIRYKEVPQFLKTIDVCLIPHKDTLYSRSMSPLKLFQYLGSGRPIVSTSIAGVERWKGLVSIAGDYQEFIQCIDTALNQDTEALSRKRIEAVKPETWDRRMEEMFKAIGNHLSPAEGIHS